MKIIDRYNTQVNQGSFILTTTRRNGNPLNDFAIVVGPVVDSSKKGQIPQFLRCLILDKNAKCRLVQYKLKPVRISDKEVALQIGTCVYSPPETISKRLWTEVLNRAGRPQK